MAETIKVRIAVAVHPNGEWNAVGWGRPNGREVTDKEKRDLAVDVMPDGESVFFVDAEIPLPKEPTIQGTVTEAP